MNLFRTRLRAELNARRVTARLEQGLRARPLGEPVDLALAPPEPGAPRWKNAVEALARALRDRAWSRADLHLVVGDESMRYAMLPSSEAVLAPEEAQALAAAVMQRTFGDRLEDWTLRVADCGGRRLLAAAIDRGLLSALEAVAAGAQCRLRTVTPAFAGLLEQHRRAAGADTWFVALEPAAAVVALIEQSELRALRLRRSPIASGAELGEMLERERARSGTELRSVAVSGAPLAGLALPDGWTLRDLTASAAAGAHSAGAALGLA